jgi:hypothetical protein
MFLLDIRRRIQQRWFDRTDRRRALQTQAPSAARQERAERVRWLQSEVHRLQLAIADLSKQQRDAIIGENSSSEAELGVLQDELVQTQQALAKLQGRV